MKKEGKRKEKEKYKKKEKSLLFLIRNIRKAISLIY